MWHLQMSAILNDGLDIRETLLQVAFLREGAASGVKQAMQANAA